MFASKDALFAKSSGGYQISRSLRFRSSASAYLSRTPASAGNRKTWTWSAWIKRGTLGANQYIFTVGSSYTDTGFMGIGFAVDSATNSDCFNLTTGTQVIRRSTNQLRDPSAWYHCLIAFDTTQSTASNRAKMYVNGAQVTVYQISNDPALNTDYGINQALATYLGRNSVTADTYFDGYIAEQYFIDGPILVGSTNGTTTITLTSGTTSGLAVGWNVGGTNIPSGAYITSITSSTQFVISSAATGTGSSISFGATPPVTAFGAFDTNGVWQPARYTGSYGTNGFYLPFSDNSALTTASNAGIGKDFSGNSNYWVTNNISITSGTTYDSMIDSPTNYADGGNGRGNYCVLNPLDKNSSATLTEANLSNYASSAAWQGARATFGINTGKWYIEGDITNHGTAYAIGFANSSWTLGQTAGDANASGIYWDGSSTSYYWFTTTVTNAGFTPANGNTFVMAIDMDAGKVWLGYRTTSTTWLGGGNPATGTTPTFTFTPNITLYPCISTYNTTQRISINFGQRPYTGTMPSGFSALNTQNLPTPTIANGAQYMAAVTYAGDSTYPRTITNGSNNNAGTTFQPDLVWVKSRSAAYSNILYDVVRGTGTGASLTSDTTQAEGANSLNANLTAFTASGFTIGSTSSTNVLNVSGQTFVGWQWKAGGTGVSNTSGSITSTVSANTSAGFSVVTYTGNGTAGATVGHGLGVIPSMIIIKNRSAASDWPVGFNLVLGAFPYTREAYLNSTAALTFGNSFNNTAPTSSAFYIGSTVTSNTNGNNYVAYCFAPVASYSSIGSYTANANPDGPMVFTNFRPRFVLLKNTTRAADWIIYDSSRDTYNASQYQLYPDLSSAEAAGANIDFLSNGFKIRGASGSGINNTSGDIYVYAAFAENPFKTARAR